MNLTYTSNCAYLDLFPCDADSFCDQLFLGAVWVPDPDVDMVQHLKLVPGVAQAFSGRRRSKGPTICANTNSIIRFGNQYIYNQITCSFLCNNTGTRHKRTKYVINAETRS